MFPILDVSLCGASSLPVATTKEHGQGGRPLPAACAASRGPAKMKADGRPLLDRFRQLAPARERVSIQRWSAQRLTLTAAAALGALTLAGLFLDSRAGLS